MPAEKATALVVRGTDWSETSRIATLFTREYGKVRALAKGGRRLKSSFDVAFDLLSVCDIVFLRKSHGGLDLLTEARLTERFPAVRADLPSLYAGYYVAELLADGTQDYDPHPVLFDAAVETLRGLAVSRSVPAAVSRFELVWLTDLGYGPRLDACAGCGADATPPGTTRVAVSPAAGGVLCPDCGPTAADRRPVTVAGLAVLRRLTAGGADLPDAVRAEVRGLLAHLVSTVLGRRPRLLPYVDGR